MNRWSRTKRYLVLSSAVALWLNAPFVVWADNAAVTTDVVHVKGTWAEEQAKLESQQTTIITKKDIAKKQAKSVEDIVFSETGVSRTVDSMGRVGVSIRGADPRHTLILVDGQPVMGDLAKYQGAGDELQRLGTENVERIEIIQGAASAKYGSDAIGGVINVITNKPRSTPSVQFNAEGRRIMGDGDIVPYSNFFMRADSGSLGKFKMNIHGSKRDIMPIYASEARRSTSMTSDEDHGFLKNSLRYYGTNSNIGLAATYDINDKQSLALRVERYNEDLERYVKRSNSYMEPQVHYKRDLDRNNLNLSYNGRNDKSSWRAELNYTRTKEDDVTLTSDYGNSTYEGKNTLNYVDNVDHRQWNLTLGGDTQINKKHFLSYGVGFVRETGEGSRLKNAPTTYKRHIDPWDYDKSLAVRNGVPSSTVYDHSFKKNEAGIEQWNKEKEWYNGDKNDASTLPEFTYEDYIRYLDTTGSDSSAVMGLVDGPTTENSLKNRNPEAYARYQQFARRLLAENQAFIADYHANKEGRTDANGKYYPALHDAYLPSFYYGAVSDFDSTQLKLNGSYFKEEYLKRVNQQTAGRAEIKKQNFYIQDTWQVNKNTTLSPIVRLDHSDLFGSNLSFNLGMTHNVKGNPHRRFKANVGTSYTEPGMGELYYNWEMYGPNITFATIGGGEARLGWYWVGNPNLKPEKAMNFDLSLEGENKNTYGKVTVFHNNIRNYMSVYNTGYLMDFYPQYDESTSYGAAKFSHAPDMIYSFRNIGKAQITGLQFEVKQNLNKHWKARLGYTYLRAINKTDKDMPRELLDKPRHKVDIGVDFEDQASGWSGSLWGDYYIHMLDSNSLSGGGNYMVSYVDPDNSDRSIIRYNMNTKRSADMYEHKTYGIWNFMIQKKIDKDSRVYFGIDNIFNHRDDDRAMSARVYRIGLNMKFGLGSGESKSKLTKEQLLALPPAVLEGFLARPFDESKKKGVELVGDYRVRSDSHLGSNRPATKITPTSSISDAAAKNLGDPKEHGLEQRIRVGVDARLNETTNVRVVGSASGQSGVDSSHVTEGSSVLNKQRLEELDVTHHSAKWDHSVGRISESMGVTGYWFNKEYDGVRSVWTNKNTQVRVGAGSFKHSTGITDSAYTHGIYTKFNRVPTVEEFIGIVGAADGSNQELVIPNAPNTINFYQQLKALHDQEVALASDLTTLKQNISDLESDIWSKENLDGWSEAQLAPLKANLANMQASLPDVEARVAKAQEPIRTAQFDVVRRMQDIVVQAYGADANKQTILIQMPEIPVKMVYKDKYYDEDTEQWVPDEGTMNVNIAPGKLGLTKNDPLYEVKLSDTSVLADNGKTFLANWYDKNKDAINASYRARAEERAKLIFSKDATYTIEFDDSALDGLSDKIYKVNAIDVKDSGMSDVINVNGSAHYPMLIASYFNNITRMLESADSHSRLPREALGKYTGAIIPTTGVVLQSDTIPPIEKAAYVQVKHMVTPRLGVAAWYLRSFGGSDYRFYTANGNSTEAHEFNNVANVFGIGAKYQLNRNASVSFDYGQNRSDFGRFMNGNTHYEHVAGTSTFDMKGRDVGGTPHFWALRFDIGKADMEKAGSWEAFVDYKYFSHGSFFGGNGTEAVPDRYLDGIKSFTFGGGYVPAKNLLLQAYYTFDAKGINKRDTLYGAENFKLGNYTRFQMTYKF